MVDGVPYQRRTHMIPFQTACALALASFLPLAAQHREANPFSSRADLEEGRKLYRLNCGVCHGMEGKSGRGARLAKRDHRHGNSDAALFRVIQNGVSGTEMPGLWMDEDSIWKILLFVRTFEVNAGEACPIPPGDAAAGAIVFRDKGCLGCHAVGREGGRLGPPLTAVGLNLAREQLSESLLEPDKQISARYRTVRVEADGRRVEGILLNEDAYTVHLMEGAGRLRSFAKDSLGAVDKPGGSLMPSYRDVLSEQQMEDLLAYMCGLRGSSRGKSE